MKSVSMLVLTLVITFLLSKSATGQGDFNKPCEDMIPVYPGAEIVESSQTDDGFIQILETTNEPDVIIIFFKKKMLSAIMHRNSKNIIKITVADNSLVKN